MDDIVILRDQDGAETEFEILDVFQYQGDEYAVLIPTDADEDDPVHILRVISEDLDAGETDYEGLDDEELIETLYEVFKKRNDL